MSDITNPPADRKDKGPVVTDLDLLNAFTTSIGSYAPDMVFTPDPTKPLFHYTDLNALSNILEKDDLWLSNSIYSNDDDELLYGRRVALTALNAELLSLQGQNPAREDFVKMVIKRIDEPQTEGVYICCFCMENDLLSQWRAYGANGTGVSIQFETSGFEQICNPSPPIEGLMRVWKVFYEESQQAKIVRSAIDFYFNYPRPPGVSPDQQADQAAAAIEFFLPTFKNANFHEEKECRLIFTPKPNPTVQPRFRVGRGMLVPFYTLQDLKTGPVGRPKHLPIEGALIGPSPNKKLNAASVKQLLSLKGYTSASVDFSKTPYRG